MKCNLCGSKETQFLIGSLKDLITSNKSDDGSLIKCRNCGFVFLENPLKGKDLVDAYQGYYTQKEISKKDLYMGDKRFTYFKDFYSGKYLYKKNLGSLFFKIFTRLIPGLNFLLLKAIRFLPSNLSLKSRQMLDIGCGNGQFLMRAKSIGFKVKGIDFDPVAVKQAVKNDLNAECIELLDIKEDSIYDAITISHVIEHISNPGDYIEKIYNLLKPNGFLYIATPNIESSGFKVFKNFWRGIDYPRHICFFSHKTLKSELEKRGFVKLEIVYDLPQSINITRSSFKLLKKFGTKNYFFYSKLFLKYLLTNPFKLKNHEVVVIKAFKPSKI